MGDYFLIKNRELEMNVNPFVQGAIYFFSVAFILGAIFFLYVGIGLRKRALTGGHLVAYCQAITVAQGTSSKINDVVNRSRDLLTRQLIPGSKLTLSAAEIGIGNIEFLLSSIINIEQRKTTFIRH